MARMPWDDKRLRVVDRRTLQDAGVDLADPRVAPYLKNRNDYSGEGSDARRAVDASLHQSAEALYDAAEALAGTVRTAAWTAALSTHQWDNRAVTHRQGADALAAAAEILMGMQDRLVVLAAAIGVRADDDEATAAMRQFVEAWRTRVDTPKES